MAKKEAIKKTEESKTENKEKSIAELKRDLQKVRLEVISGKSKDTSAIKKIRKEIARKLTINKK